jgi:hypothetical protein
MQAVEVAQQWHAESMISYSCALLSLIDVLVASSIIQAVSDVCIAAEKSASHCAALLLAAC